jgi:perosamine synthetase
MTIPYARQSLNERDVEAVLEVLRGDWLTQGPRVRDFEEAVASSCEVPYAVAFSSGTAALHAAVLAGGLGPDDELVTSGLTFAASANCAAYVGAVPRFADIDPQTWNVSGETVAAACGRRTRAVVPVHFAGLPAPVDEIRERVGDEILLIEDASHALGASNDGDQVGSCSHADMAIFSFHPAKAIACGEGGMVTARDEALATALREARNHGFTKDPARLERHDGPWYVEQQMLGFNYRLSDVHSALGRSQLERLDAFIQRRNDIADRYRAGLGDLDALALPPAAPSGSRHAYHLFVIRHKDGPDARRTLYTELHARGILVQVHYVPVYLHPYYRHRYAYAEGLCPEVEEYYSSCVSIPCFPALTDAEQDEVILAIRDIVS